MFFFCYNIYAFARDEGDLFLKSRVYKRLFSRIAKKNLNLEVDTNGKEVLLPFL